jgi:hypothetical protein
VGDLLDHLRTRHAVEGRVARDVASEVEAQTVLPRFDPVFMDGE